MAGRRKDGRRDAEPWACGSRVPRTEEDLLTSLFGGIGEVDRFPTMGAVEPSWEKAMEPLEYESAGDRGDGLGFLLELEMVEIRFIHEVRLVGPRTDASDSVMSWSLGA